VFFVSLLLILLSACGQLEGPVLLAAPVETTVKAKLTASAPSERAFFGDSVAIHGRTAVVGAWGEGEEAGAAYVYVARNGGWTLQDTLRVEDGAPGERFGHAVAVHSDTIVVGAVYDGEFGFRAGAAYLFVREGSSWHFQAKLTAPDAAAYQQFGSAVAVGDDVVAVGASGFSGRAVYLFDRAGAYQTTLRPGDLHEDARFGSALALAGDTLVAGAWQDELFDEHDGEAPVLGTVYFFERSGAGWREVARFTSPSGNPGFGYAVAVGNGTAAVGTPGESVSVFARRAGAWLLAATLSAPDAPHFGSAVALGGGRLAVGAPGGAGTVFIYRQNGHAWTLAQRVQAPSGNDALHLGGAVAASGQRLIAGATGDRAGGIASGAVYVIP
jgi:hypothetical protein